MTILEWGYFFKVGNHGCLLLMMGLHTIVGHQLEEWCQLWRTRHLVELSFQPDDLRLLRACLMKRHTVWPFSGGSDLHLLCETKVVPQVDRSPWTCWFPWGLTTILGSHALQLRQTPHTNEQTCMKHKANDSSWTWYYLSVNHWQWCNGSMRGHDDSLSWKWWNNRQAYYLIDPKLTKTNDVVPWWRFRIRSPVMVDDQGAQHGCMMINGRAIIAVAKNNKTTPHRLMMGCSMWCW